MCIRDSSNVGLPADGVAMTLPLHCTVQWNVHFVCQLLHFCQLRSNPSIDLEPEYVFGKPMKHRFQWYIVRTEILTFHTRVEYINVGLLADICHDVTAAPCSEARFRMLQLLHFCTFTLNPYFDLEPMKRRFQRWPGTCYRMLCVIRCIHLTVFGTI